MLRTDESTEPQAVHSYYLSPSPDNLPSEIFTKHSQQKAGEYGVACQSQRTLTSYYIASGLRKSTGTCVHLRILYRSCAVRWCPSSHIENPGDLSLLSANESWVGLLGDNCILASTSQLNTPFGLAVAFKFPSCKLDFYFNTC